PRGPRRPHGAQSERIAYRLLERGAQIGKLLTLRNSAAQAQVLRDRRLEAAEGKVELLARTLRQAAGEIEGPRIAASRELVDLRAARIGEPEQPGYLVERLAGRVVQGVAEQPIATDLADLVEAGVTAGDDERQPGRRRSGVVEEDREQVTLEVIDLRERQPRRHRERFCHLHADEERADETRPAGHREPV